MVSGIWYLKNTSYLRPARAVSGIWYLNPDTIETVWLYGIWYLVSEKYILSERISDTSGCVTRRSHLLVSGIWYLNPDTIETVWYLVSGI